MVEFNGRVVGMGGLHVEGQLLCMLLARKGGIQSLCNGVGGGVVWVSGGGVGEWWWW